MRRLAFLGAFVWALVLPSQMVSAQTKTRVEFSAYQTEGWIHSAKMKTWNDSPNSQIIIVIRRNGVFSIPFDGNQEPALAMRIGNLGRTPTSNFNYEWNVILDLRPAPQEFYAIVCQAAGDVGVESLRYLSLKSATDISATTAKHREC